ncbi:MAG: helix-turn-helix transcriptional regulator [Chitinophagaceae bacterium]|nr:helix-turn-helix transcriptional regulator [Chitinophagaceae bacterium]
MESSEKLVIKARFGVCIQKIIAENKSLAKAKEDAGIKEHRLITSLRKLAASSGIEFSIIQKISAGKRNPELTTIVGIADGFGINEAELFSRYNQVTDTELKSLLATTQKLKKVKSPKKARKKK